MPIEKNFPGPLELRIFYTVDGLQHVQKLNVNYSGGVLAVGTPFASIPTLTKGGATGDFASLLTSYLSVLKPLLSAAESTIDSAECWQYEPGTFNATFISASAVGQAGTNVSSYGPAAQVTYTYRTNEGGHMRVTVLESVVGATIGDKTPYASITGASKTFADWFTATTTPVLARDTSYAAVCIRRLIGQNEKTFRQRFR